MKRAIYKSSRPAIPVLGYLLFVAWVLFVILALVRFETGHSWPQAVMIYLTMIALCAWIVIYHCGGEFAEREWARINRFYPLEGKGKAESLMHWNFWSCVLSGLTYLLVLVQYIAEWVFWPLIVINFLMMLVCLIKFYNYTREILFAANLTWLIKLFPYICAAVLFIAKLLSGGFILEYIEVDPHHLPGVAWGTDIFYLIPLVIMVCYPLSLLLFNYLPDKYARDNKMVTALSHCLGLLFLAYLSAFSW